MEEFVAVGLQLFFEIGIQFLGAPGIDGASTRSSDKAERVWAWVTLHTFLGGLTGWISTLIFPKLILAHFGLRVANLVVAPLLAGGTSHLMAKWMKRPTETSAPFWHGFAFALAFGLARFAFGQR